MKKIITSVLLVCSLTVAPLVIIGCSGCKSSKLEAGGAYAPTNALGGVAYSDKGLALADASYKLAYQTVQGVLKFERDNRQAIWNISPDVKGGLDKVRPEIVSIDQRWVFARSEYKKNPTPEGLTTLQQILSELNRLVPVIQSQVTPVQNVITNSNP